MCGRFEVLTYDELGEVIARVQRDIPNVMPDWPAVPGGRTHARPGAQVDLLVPNGPRLQRAAMGWGFNVGGKLVFNTRIEKALGPHPGMWERPLREGRCIVATPAFYEPHATETRIAARTGKPVKAQYRFASPDQPCLLLAAVSQDDRFSIVTTQPNRHVAPIHDRMPLALAPAEVQAWLEGDFAHLSNRDALALTAELEEDGSLPQAQQMSLF